MNSRINKDKTEISQQLNKAHQHIKDINQQFESYMANYNQKIKNHDKLLDDYNQQKELIQKLNKKRTEYEKQINSVQSMIKMKEDDLTKFHKEAEEYYEKAKMLQEEKDTIKEQFKSLNKDNENLKNEKEKLINENQQLTIKIKGLEAAASYMASLPDDDEDGVNYQNYVYTKSVENLQESLTDLINLSDNVPQTGNDINIFMRSTQKQFRNILSKFYSVLEGLNIPNFPNTFDEFIEKIKTGGPDKGEIIQGYINKIKRH